MCDEPKAVGSLSLGGKARQFLKTADRLYTTQPAISSRITNLEEELRTKLFDREAGLVRLTPDGQA